MGGTTVSGSAASKALDGEGCVVGPFEAVSLCGFFGFRTGKQPGANAEKRLRLRTCPSGAFLPSVTISYEVSPQTRVRTVTMKRKRLCEGCSYWQWCQLR